MITEGTLGRAITESARVYGSKTLIHHPVGEGQWARITYAEFTSMGRAAGRALVETHGVRPGDRVAIWAENSPRWQAAFLGIMLAGAKAVPLDARLTPTEAANILADSETRLLIASAQTAEGARDALAIELVAGACEGIRTTDMDALPWGGPEMGGAVDGVDDVAMLLYTSGTTGNPKAVMLTHANIISDVRGLGEVGIITDADTIICLLPLHHIYAFTCGFVGPLLLGSAITFPSDLKGPAIVEAAKATGATVLPGVPQLLTLMRNRIYEKFRALPGPLGRVAMGVIRASGFVRRQAGVNLMGAVFKPLGKRFRFFTSGGARLEPDVMMDLEALGLTVLEGYGLTETSPIACFNRLGQSRPGSVGVPLPGAEIRIVGAKAGGDEGEVAIKGPMVMKGYYRKPAETLAVMKDGWFLSGDLGYVDGDGYLRLTGRKKEIIVLSSGKNIYPEEVEKHYAKCPLIREVCVYESGGQLKAVIVPDADEMRARGVANIAENLRWEIEALSGGLPPQMRIKGYELRSEPLPRTPLGKLRRFMVHAARAEADLKERPDDPAFADEAGRAVREGLRALLPPGTPVRGEDNIELDLGVDSLMRLELAVSVERALGIKIPSEVAVHAHTVAELADGVRTLEASAGAGAALGGSAEGMDAVLEAEPTERELVEAGMDGTRIWPLAAAVVLGLKVLMRVVYRMEVRGAHNIPAPPFILAPNHVSFIDAPVLAAGVPLGVLRNLRFLGIEKYFRTRVMKFGGRTLGVIRIDPDAHLSHAMKLSAAAIRGGNSLVIFPEGGRSFDGRLMPFKKGVGILSLKLGVPVVPVRIDGAHDALPRGARFLRPARIRLTFGTPIAPAMPEGVADPAQAMADRVRAVIEAMGR